VSCRRCHLTTAAFIQPIHKHLCIIDDKSNFIHSQAVPQQEFYFDNITKQPSFPLLATGKVDSHMILTQQEMSWENCDFIDKRQTNGAP